MEMEKNLNATKKLGVTLKSEYSNLEFHIYGDTIDELNMNDIEETRKIIKQIGNYKDIKHFNNRFPKKNFFSRFKK